VNPFALLAELDHTGLVTIETSMVSKTMRSTEPAGSTVDLAWRLGSQVRYDRWSFEKRDGLWRVALVEPGVPQFDGLIVGATARIRPSGVEMPWAELFSPGGVELLLEVDPAMVADSALLVFPDDACERSDASPLTAMVQVSNGPLTLWLDGPASGSFSMALVPSDEPAVEGIDLRGAGDCANNHRRRPIQPPSRGCPR
jgi:hypothetical protein